MKVVLIAGLACGVLLLGLVVVAGTSGSGQLGAVTLAADVQCEQVSTAVASLTPSQASNAATIVATTAALSGESHHAERIALMVAITESGLHDQGPRAGNGGSLGLFQQRRSQGWGTAAEELDPADATAMFVHRLLQVPGWRTMAPWLAAQAVQRSAFAHGSNYAANWGEAGAVLGAVTGSFTAGGCGGGPPGGEAGPASSFGLPADFTIPASATPAERAVLTYALAQLGHPYVWGAAGPVAFDCSGLTMMAWRQAGVSLEHYTVSQMHEGEQVPPSAIAPGDLVLIPGVDPPGPGLPGHVGIYLGDGLVESAVDPQLGVVVQSWSTFVSGGLDAVVNPAV